jgi:hypothetical protein
MKKVQTSENRKERETNEVSSRMVPIFFERHFLDTGEISRRHRRLAELGHDKV